MAQLVLPNLPWSAPHALEPLSQELEALPTADVVSWAVASFGPGMALASSFGAEDMVLLDLWDRTNQPIEVFCLDTGLLFYETYALITEVEKRYAMTVTRVRPQLSVPEQAATIGKNLWQENPDRCCAIRKLAPLAQHLKPYQAWMTGIRRDQTAFRRLAPLVSWDSVHGLVKINPLVNWTATEVFQYLREHQVPYNPLHDVGYPSIGCQPCTKPVVDGDDLRAGRWQGKEKTECGLHL